MCEKRRRLNSVRINNLFKTDRSQDIVMTPKEAREYIESTGAAYGQDVMLPDTIDTSSCQNFFGTRCDANIHIKGPMKAHIDRVDPRYDPIGHLKKDVGVPYTVIGSALGAGIGGLVAGNNRKKGAATGALIGGTMGLLADLLSDYKKETNQAI